VTACSKLLRPVVIHRETDYNNLTEKERRFLTSLEQLPQLFSSLVGIGPSKIINGGLGLFAKVNILPGTKICSYLGRKSRRVPCNSTRTIRTMDGWYIDGLSKGGYASYANDPCSKIAENSELIEDDEDVFIESTKWIRACDEIYVDYGLEFYSNETLNLSYRRQGIIRHWEEVIKLSKSESFRDRARAIKFAKVIGAENELCV